MATRIFGGTPKITRETRVLHQNYDTARRATGLKI